MNVSFSNTEIVPTPVEGVEIPTVTGGTTAPTKGVPPPVDLIVALASENSLATPANPFLGDYLPGFSDMILPRINIVQGLSENPLGLPLGSVVFDKKVPLFSPSITDKNTGIVKSTASPAIILAVLGIASKRFVEKSGSGERGLIVNTEDEVRASGGTTDYREWQLKEKSGMLYFQQLVDFVIVLRRPEAIADDDTVFTFGVGDTKYALGMWACKGTAYNEAAKRVLFPARRIGCLRQGGYPSYHYKLTTVLRSYPGNKSAWVPVLQPGDKSSPQFLDFAKEIIAG